MWAGIAFGLVGVALAWLWMDRASPEEGPETVSSDTVHHDAGPRHGASSAQFPEASSHLRARFPFVRESAGFVIMASIADDLEHLEHVASTASARAAAVTGPPLPSAASRALPIYICSSDAEVREVERAHRLFYTLDSRRGTLPVAGGFYPQVPMIAVYSSEIPSDVLVAHEVVHHVLFRRCECIPDLIEEGLALALEGEVLQELGVRESLLAAYGELWRHVLSEMLSARGMPTLESLLKMSYYEFRGPSSSENCALATCVAAVLLGKEGSGRFAGKLPELLENLTLAANTTTALEMTFGDTAAFEVEWGEVVRALAER